MSLSIVVIVCVFVGLMLLGAPIFVSLATSAIVANTFFLHVPGMVVAQGFFTAIDSWPLVCVPFFLFSGNLMGECGPAAALFELCDKWVGHIRGGLPAAVVLSCCLFGAITGSGVATAVAIGTLAIPEMLKRGYSRPFCYGLIAVAGPLGLMIPPSVYMILFAGITNGDILEYFTAGYVPGIFMAIVLIIFSAVISRKVQVQEKASWAARWRSLRDALPALGMPVVVMGSIYAGIFTPTESAALSVVYTVLVCPFFYKSKFSWALTFVSAKKAALTTSQVYVIVGAVNSFAAVLTYLHVPQQISEGITATHASGMGLLFLIVVLYFVLGMFIDAVPIMYLTVPILFPVLSAIGVNELHFMILTITMLMIGQATPPFGVVLFTISGNFKAKIEEVVKGAVPFLVAMLICAVLIVLIPQISTWFPGFVLGR